MLKIHDIEQDKFQEFLGRAIVVLSMRTRDYIPQSKRNRIAKAIMKTLRLDLELTIDKSAKKALLYEFGSSKSQADWKNEYEEQFSAHDNHEKRLQRAMDIICNSPENPLIKLILETLEEHAEESFVRAVRRSYESKQR